MGVDEEVDSKRRSWINERKELHKPLRDIERFTVMPQGVLDVLRE